MHIYAGQIPVITEGAKDPFTYFRISWNTRIWTPIYTVIYLLNSIYAHLYIAHIYIYINTFGCKHHYKYFHTTMHCIKGEEVKIRITIKGGYCNIHVLCLWNIFIIRLLSQLLIHHLLTLPTYHCCCCRGCLNTTWPVEHWGWYGCLYAMTWGLLYIPC